MAVQWTKQKGSIKRNEAMIKKIKRDEYLERYEAMSDEERKDYQKRVGEWLGDGGRWLIELTERPMAKSQNIVLLSARWKEKEVGAFAEGAQLLTALVGVAETWLPTQLYAKSAYRAVRQMVGCLEGQTETLPRPLPVKEGSDYTNGGDGRDGMSGQRMKEALGTKTPSAKPTGTVTEAVAAPSLTGKAGGVALVRPRHIDQYVHLLPEATQKRAAMYGELMRDFDLSREKLRIVMDDPQASDRDREEWAKRVSKLDGQIGAIRRELDREWEKVAASGRVVVDELGMAHLLPVGEATGTGSFPAVAGLTDGTALAAPTTDEKADDLRRAAQLRKWLIDTRYGNKGAEKRAKYQEKWREKYREMVRLGGMEAVTEKVREAAKHYEIDLDSLNTNDHK